MYIEELFEKGDRYQYQLLDLLRQNPAGCTVEFLQETLDVSAATLQKYLDTLQLADVGKVFEVRVEGDRYELHLTDTASWADVVYYFVRRSVKWQILEILLREGNFAIPHLADRLAISQATLNRTLSQLNRSLKEFHIKIRNGQLQGPEHQIRLLYYLLLVQFGEAQAVSAAYPYVVEEATLQVKQWVHREMMAPQQRRLRYWLAIAYERSRVKGLNWTLLRQQFAGLYDRLIYQRLEQDLQEVPFFKKDIEYEGMNLLIFLMSMEVISVPFSEKITGFGGPVSEATREVLAYYRKALDGTLYLHEGSLYQVSQLMSRLYFFHGEVSGRSEVGPSEPAFVYPLEPDAKHVRDLRQVLASVYGTHYKHLKFKPSDTLLNQSARLLASHLQGLLFQEPAPFVIGVDIAKGDLYRDVLFFQLREHLSFNDRLHWTLYQNGGTYDLVVTDDPLASYAGSVYVIKDWLGSYDFVHLQRYLEEMVRW